MGIHTGENVMVGPAHALGIASCEGQHLVALCGTPVIVDLPLDWPLPRGVQMCFQRRDLTAA
ncbi:hypothetical protein ASG36_20570 [Geodermatophilus sp. Leaf369]|nr:hypothetical protein ASG36_20570 [Geodermatophilus sp. Leaf369]